MQRKIGIALGPTEFVCAFLFLYCLSLVEFISKFYDIKNVFLGVPVPDSAHTSKTMFCSRFLCLPQHIIHGT